MAGGLPKLGSAALASARIVRRRMAAHRPSASLLAVVVLVASAGDGAAQVGGGGPTLNTLALEWTRGQYITPLMCEFDGVPRRGGRRIVIGPGSRHARPPENRIHFVSLQVPTAKRCFTDFGEEEFEVTGKLTITLPGPARSDTASHDFSATLRRDRGFDFKIRSGVLQIEAIGAGDSPPRRVDFEGGRARVSEIGPGSDAARLLAEYPGRRLMLELEASDGTRLLYRMVQATGR